MKNQLIATLVAGLLMFIWQFLTWGILNLHEKEFTYTPNQDAILAALSSNLTEDGSYYMPNLPPGSSHEEHEAAMKDMMGKPWAIIKYQKAADYNMGMNMFRGISVDILAAFLLIWLLSQLRQNSFKTSLIASLVVGSIGYLSITYTNGIWFDANTLVHLLDTLVMWGLVGSWLGWWLNRP